jgi:hypothetical protein
MERPLIMLKFQVKELAICPQCLPTLIHKPYQLADKLPGVMLPQSGENEDRP